MAWTYPEITGTKLVFFGNGDGEYQLNDLLGSEAEVLGKGTFGTSYRAKLEGKKDVAVKRLRDIKLSEMEFKENVDELGKMAHENLLPIRAYWCVQDERILVYDYMSMGSLAFLLHGNGDAIKMPLNWEVRRNIAYGVARGIAYIHTQGSNFCHGNIRSSNVFLTNFFDVRLSEYGISRLLSPKFKPKLIEGYCAPEVSSPYEISQKSDVYSFGVVLLELLTGKLPVGLVLRSTEGVDLPKWVRSMFLEKPIVDVFDNVLHEYQNIEEEMVQLLQLAVCCTFGNPRKRPSMAAVTNQIKQTCRFK